MKSNLFPNQLQSSIPALISEERRIPIAVANDGPGLLVDPECLSESGTCSNL